MMTDQQINNVAHEPDDFDDLDDKLLTISLVLPLGMVPEAVESLVAAMTDIYGQTSSFTISVQDYDANEEDSRDVTD